MVVVVLAIVRIFGKTLVVVQFVDTKIRWRLVVMAHYYNNGSLGNSHHYLDIQELYEYRVPDGVYFVDNESCLFRLDAKIME